MFDLFIAGGPGAMSLLSVELVCLFFAAWKAPAWVREIGLLALVTGCFWQFAGLFQAAGVVAEVGEWPSVGLLLNGFKVSLIPVMYGSAPPCRFVGPPQSMNSVRCSGPSTRMRTVIVSSGSSSSIFSGHSTRQRLPE